jgi:hypothetical protein
MISMRISKSLWRLEKSMKDYCLHVKQRCGAETAIGYIIFGAGAGAAYV